MNKSEVNELKKRLTKSGCSFTKMCGCYVDAEKNRIVDINETFLNLDEDEFFKYLELAKKTLSGTLHNNLLELSFPLEEEQAGGRQQFLMALRESKLKNEDLLDRFYELIINTYDYTGNYLILIFHDAYDVMKKTSDRNELDESEEVFEYLLCAICPVTLSKPGLGYREEEHRIGSRIRDWVVSAPDTGFLFPAFNDRSTDIHSLLFYTKDTKEPHIEFMEAGLACEAKQTATEQRIAFNTIVNHALGASDPDSDLLVMDLQQNLHDLVTEHIEVLEEDTEAFVLDSVQLEKVMNESQIPEEKIDQIKESYSETFGKEPPAASHLVDAKAVKSNAPKIEKRQLVKQVAALTQQLDETLAEEKVLIPAVKTDSIILKVKPEKVPEIKTELREGRHYLVIPVDETERLLINEQETLS